jgi:hypothetical protein
MDKARPHPEVVTVHIIEPHPNLLAKRGGSAPHIHGYIKHLAPGAAQQLSLQLHMQPK